MAIKVSPNRKVNTNPRPPNEPKIGNAKKVAGAQPGNTNRIGNAKAVTGSKGSRTGSSSTVRSTAPSLSSSVLAVQPLGDLDPRDATYWETLSTLEFNKNKELEHLHEEGIFDEGAHNREVAEQERINPIEQRNLREGANVAGEIYSSATTNAANELGLNQANRRSAIEEAYQRLISQRANEGREVEGRFNLGKTEAYGNAVQRAIEQRAAEKGPEVIENNYYGNESAPVEESSGGSSGGGGNQKPPKPANAPAGKKWAWNGSHWHLVKA